MDSKANADALNQTLQTKFKFQVQILPTLFRSNLSHLIFQV